MFSAQRKLLVNIVKNMHTHHQALPKMSQLQRPLSRHSFYAVGKFNSSTEDKNNKFNSYINLRKWLENDLNFKSSPASTTHLREVLASISRKTADSAELNTHQKEIIRRALNSTDSEFIGHIKSLYLETFFSEDQYQEGVSYFEKASSEVEATKKLKALDRPHTLAYVALLSDDPRQLDQLGRATTVAIAALNLYQRFKNKDYTAYMNPNGDMDTTSYRNFFGVTTHPSDSNDFDILNSNHESQHIIIMHLGCAYELTVYNAGKLISIEDINASIAHILQSTKTNSHSLGAISTASRILRKKIRSSLLKSDKDSLNCLENALFVLCLDDKSYPTNEAEFVYAHGFENRYFGNTQLIIGAKGEAAVIANYVKIEGTPALELIDTIYHDSVQVKLPEANLQISNVRKLAFSLDEASIKVLEEDTKSVIHDSKSNHTIPLGINFFKNLKLSPNIAMNLIVLMAVYNINNKLPVLNHATSRRDQNNPAAQLDWNYICPSKINKFILACQNLPLLKYNLNIINDKSKFNECKNQAEIINIYQDNDNFYYSFYHQNLQININGTVKKDLLPPKVTASTFNISEKNHLVYYILNQHGCVQDVGNIFDLLEDAISSCKENIYSAKRGMSPIFFLNKPQGEAFDELCNFYLSVGEHYPAYRNYLFRAFRNKKSVDIMTSSLQLPKSIKTIGRHGTCSEVLSEFGLHILMKSNETEFVFIPNRETVNKLDLIIENIILWSNKINLIAHAKFNQQLNTKPESQTTLGKAA